MDRAAERLGARHPGAARRSRCSATTTSTARPRRRCCTASSGRSARPCASTFPTASTRATARTPRRCGGCAARASRSSSPSTAASRPHEALADAAEAGLEVIVVDHHVAEPRLPQALRRRQSQPARRERGSGPSGGGRRRLPAGRGTQPRGCAISASTARRGPSRTCAAGSIWWRSARCATSCRSTASTAPSWRRASR